MSDKPRASKMDIAILVAAAAHLCFVLFTIYDLHKLKNEAKAAPQRTTPIQLQEVDVPPAGEVFSIRSYRNGSVQSSADGIASGVPAARDESSDHLKSAGR